MKNKPAYILGRLAACYKTITGAEEIPAQMSEPGILFSNPSELATRMMVKLESAEMSPLIQPMYDNVKELAETLTDFPIYITDINAFLGGYATQQYMMIGLDGDECDNER